MKRFILVAGLILLTYVTIQALPLKRDIEGIWTNGKVNFTFVKDSLYIDEIDNEGFGYKAAYNGDTIQCTDNVTTDTFHIIVKSLDKQVLEFYYKEDGKKEIIELNKLQ